jgi:polyisoprenoid-binding protein YceI
MKKFKLTLVTMVLFCFKIMSQNVVGFKIKNAGFNVDGKFEKVTSSISYNPSDVTKSTFSGTISTTSINTDNKKRDEHLRKNDYFDVAKYPNITFKSTSVKSNGPDKLIVNGTLTIKNVSKPVALNVNVQKVNNKHTFTTSLDLNRLDYGVGDKSFILSDNLKINLKISE